MFEIFEKLLSLKELIWLMPAVFILHDAEELITAQKWLSENRGVLEPFVKKYRFIKSAVRSADLTKGQMSVAIVFELIVILFAVTASSSDITAGPALYFFAALNGAFLLHVLSHILQSAVLKKYTPGVVTAAVLVLPYALYVYHRFFWGGILSLPEVLISLGAGAVIVLPIILTGHFLGRKLVAKS